MQEIADWVPCGAVLSSRALVPKGLNITTGPFDCQKKCKDAFGATSHLKFLVAKAKEKNMFKKWVANFMKHNIVFLIIIDNIDPLMKLLWFRRHAPHPSNITAVEPSMMVRTKTLAVKPCPSVRCT